MYILCFACFNLKIFFFFKGLNEIFKNFRFFHYRLIFLFLLIWSF